MSSVRQDIPSDNLFTEDEGKLENNYIIQFNFVFVKTQSKYVLNSQLYLFHSQVNRTSRRTTCPAHSAKETYMFGPVCNNTCKAYNAARRKYNRHRTPNNLLKLQRACKIYKYTINKISCDSLMPGCKPQSRFIALASSLNARGWVRPQTL